MVKKIDNEINYKWESANHHTPKIENALSKILNNPIYKSLNHLDVGCGNGALTVKFYKHFNKTLGIDLSEDGIKFAKNLKMKKLNLNMRALKI